MKTTSLVMLNMIALILGVHLLAPTFFNIAGIFSLFDFKMPVFKVSCIAKVTLFRFFFKCIFLLSREPIDNLTPEERDARTVFCMQLAARIRPRDLEEFFSTVGKVSNKEVEVILSTWSGVSS